MLVFWPEMTMALVNEMELMVGAVSLEVMVIVTGALVTDP
jgi:hypothetical protein